MSNFREELAGLQTPVEPDYKGAYQHWLSCPSEEPATRTAYWTSSVAIANASLSIRISQLTNLCTRVFAEASLMENRARTYETANGKLVEENRRLKDDRDYLFQRCEVLETQNEQLKIVGYVKYERTPTGWVTTFHDGTDSDSPRTDDVLAEVRAERTRQDEKWGGPTHDDQHRLTDWDLYIRTKLHDVIGGHPQRARKALVQIAALAVAAIESHDRLELD